MGFPASNADGRKERLDEDEGGILDNDGEIKTAGRADRHKGRLGFIGYPDLLSTERTKSVIGHGSRPEYDSDHSVGRVIPRLEGRLLRYFWKFRLSQRAASKLCF